MGCSRPTFSIESASSATALLAHVGSRLIGIGGDDVDRELRDLLAGLDSCAALESAPTALCRVLA